MRFDTVIELIAETFSVDGIGREVSEPSARRVFANEWSVSSREFYDAGRAGLMPERQYQVRSCEYAGERLLDADGERYEIIRTERRGEWTRLVCQRVTAQRGSVR